MHHNNPPFTRVVFFQVKTAFAKVESLCKVAKEHFERKEPLIIFVEDERAKTFVDELLWKMPPFQFLPHVASDAPSQEFVQITKAKHNLNQAKVAFNLCSTPLVSKDPYRIIYELEDLTMPAKSKLFSIRFDRYKQEGYLIESYTHPKQ
jgi:DNA polymerase-3 subunit chi